MTYDGCARMTKGQANAGIDHLKLDRPENRFAAWARQRCRNRRKPTKPTMEGHMAGITKREREDKARIADQPYTVQSMLDDLLDQVVGTNEQPKEKDTKPKKGRKK
jgi:hypothetical protein